MSTCSTCGAQFACGMVAQDQPGGEATGGACWCIQFPPLVAVPDADAAASCLCPNCLQALLHAARQQA